MNKIRLNRFPGGRRKALTFSYDDGVSHDRRLVDIFNRYGMKGTFHLNSGTLNRENNLHGEELAELFHGHEISAHSVTHPHLPSLPVETLAWEMLEDRRQLEQWAGYPVRGMSYPFGTYDDATVARLPAYGIEYARTVQSHGGFQLPNDWLRWHPTCHHNQEILEKADAFLSLPKHHPLRLFYIWGHSYEFNHNNNWELMERFCEKMAAHHETVWAATNIAIHDYCEAMRQIKVSVEGNLAYNPTAIPVWIEIDGEAVVIESGEHKRL